MEKLKKRLRKGVPGARSQTSSWKRNITQKRGPKAMLQK